MARTMNGPARLLRPGLRFGERPERVPCAISREHWTSAAAANLPKRPSTRLSWVYRYRRHLQAPRSIPWLMARLIDCEIDGPAGVDTDAALARQLRPLRRALRRHGLTESLTIRALALVRIVAHRELGIEPHPEQLFAAWAMLQGSIVEMATGEGKTVTAGLVAAVAALAGVPVHVLTVNDYLVKRDARFLEAFYRRFGLSTGVITGTMQDQERQTAYRADIVYATSQQLVFDYLRDVRALGDLRHGLKYRLSSLLQDKPGTTMLRGLCLAIIDEVDSVLIDEARTPLILAQARPLTCQERAEAAMALAIARSLIPDTDFAVDTDSRSATLTDAGRTAIATMSETLSGRWRQARYRTECVLQALVALNVYQRDRHYLVAGDKVLLIDEGTGRTLPDRKLQHGLHQMLELKERCGMTAATDIAASLSFQRFFVRYGMLCGMSGTTHGVRSELRRVYRTAVVMVPAHLPCRRRQAPMRVMPSRAAQLRLLLQRVSSCQLAGQPVLIGTRSVALSEIVSTRLGAHAIAHTLLNARQDAAEAAIVAAAGQRGAVTVATNMAGRGTDIVLGAGVAELGGLHVINLEVNDSRRVDRQLFGRAARQGDPGSCEALLAVDDTMLQQCLPKPLLSSMEMLTRLDSRAGQLLAAGAVAWTQRQRERRHARARLTLFRDRDRHDRLLAVAGDAE